MKYLQISTYCVIHHSWGPRGFFGSDSRKFAKFGTDVVHTVLNHFKMGAKIGAPWYCHIAQSNMAATRKKRKVIES